MSDFYVTTLADAVNLVPEVREHLSPTALLLLARLETKAAGSLMEVNADYHDRITEALIGYFEGGNSRAAQNAFKRAAVMAFSEAFGLGWQEGGAREDYGQEENQWLISRTEAEFAFIAQLFQNAKQLRKEEGFDAFGWISERADGYTRTLASIYNAGRMFAQKGMLTWHLGMTEKHCDTCAGLNGKAHRASWYMNRNYIPRSPGASMDCGGYQCDCYLTKGNGEKVTL